MMSTQPHPRPTTVTKRVAITAKTICGQLITGKQSDYSSVMVYLAIPLI